MENAEKRHKNDILKKSSRVSENILRMKENLMKRHNSIVCLSVIFLIAINIFFGGCSKNEPSSDSMFTSDKDIAEKAVQTYIEQQLYFKNEEARKLGIFLGGQRAISSFFTGIATQEALICKIKEQNLYFLTETQIDLLAKELAELQSMSKYHLSSQEKDGTIIIQVEIDAPDIEKIQQDVFKSSLKKCESKYSLTKNEFSMPLNTLPDLMTCYGEERFFKHVQQVTNKNGWSSNYNMDLVKNRLISFQREISDIIMDSYHEILRDSNNIPFKKLKFALNASVENGNTVLIKQYNNESSLESINQHIWSGFSKVIDPQKSSNPNPNGDFSNYNVEAPSLIIDGKNRVGYGHGETAGMIENTKISFDKLPDWKITAILLGNQNPTDFYKDEIEKTHLKDIEKVKNTITYSKVNITTNLILQNNKAKDKIVKVKVELCDAYGRCLDSASLSSEATQDKPLNSHIFIDFPTGKQEKIPLKIEFDMWQLKDSSSDAVVTQLGQNFMLHVDVIEGNTGFSDIYIPLNNQSM